MSERQQQQPQLNSDPFSNQQQSTNSNSYNEASRNVTFAVQKSPEPDQQSATSPDPLSDPGSPPSANSLTVSVVKPLADTPENVRWMYKGDSEKLWKPFTGYDSTKLEARYQEIKGSLKHPLGIRVAPASAPASETVAVEGAVNVPATANVTTKSTLVSEFLQHPERRFSLVNKTIFSSNETWTAATNKWFPRTGSGSANTSGTGTETTTNDATDGQPQIEPQPIETSAATTGTDTEDWISNKGLLAQPPPAHIVIVRSGLYEVDLNTWRCKSTFWPCDSANVVRGTWFLEATWKPLPMDYAEQLEREHLEKFAEAPIISPVFPLSHSLPESPTKGGSRGGSGRPVAHRVNFPEYHVDWTSPTEIHLFRKRSSSAFMKSVSQKLGFQWGERVSRGYFQAAQQDDKPPDVGHVVFVVHGIGQKMDANRIVRNCSTFRENINGLQTKYFDVDGADSGAANTNKIAVFFPIEWRTALRLDGDLVESITPNKIVGLRQLLNTTAMDIMYYASPLYRSEIRSALCNELNRTYHNFLRRRPNFVADGGKFSILAHSLGSVITYDIITCPLLMETEESPERRIERRVKAQSPEHEKALVLTEAEPNLHLAFNLEHFFCLGSPLSVFLALRWRQPDNPSLRGFIIPDSLCKRMYNIFDLNDPIAYRLEPLLNRAYMHIPPTAITNNSAPPHVKYEEMVREIVNKESSRLEPPEYVPSGDSANDAGSGPTSAYFFDGEMEFFQQQKSPPATIGPIGAGMGAGLSGPGSFFGAVYNYWNQKQATEVAVSYNGLALQDDEPDEMEAAAAKLDSIKFHMSSFEERERTAKDMNLSPTGGDGSDDAGHSMSMNIGSDFVQSFHSSTSDFTTIGSGSDGGPPPKAGSGMASPPGGVTTARQPITNDLDYRLDFVMRESSLPIPTGYLNALTSHTSYWSSSDIGFFILAHLYNRIPSERRRPSDSVTSPQ